MFMTLILILKILHLYYKEQRQLETFLTQIGPAIPLTSDPLVICFWE
jgi:hypothetical protein